VAKVAGPQNNSSSEDGWPDLCKVQQQMIEAVSEKDSMTQVAQDSKVAV